MKDIATYIEHLLLHHDCVIVPGLGGFVAQDMPASYIVREGVFLPPYRNVSFNSRLTMNDGLLAQCISYDQDVTYAEALCILEREVEKFRRELGTAGSLALNGVGTLRNVVGGAYEFTPLPCGILSPRHYGLDSVYAASIARDSLTCDTESHTQLAEAITLRIPMAFLRYAAVVAVLVLLYFIRIPLGTAVGQETSEAGIFRQTAALLQTTVGEDIENGVKDAVGTSRHSTHAPEAPVTASAGKMAAMPAKVTETVRPQEALPPSGSTYNALPFTIVLASAVSHQGAAGLVESMKDFGDGSAREVRHGKMTRVVYGAFTTKNEAWKALRTMRTKDRIFAEAWVMELPQ